MIKEIYQKIKKKYIKPKIERISIYHPERAYMSHGKIPGYLITASEYDECGRRKGDR
jgi:hypothetical protein